LRVFRIARICGFPVYPLSARAWIELVLLGPIRGGSFLAIRTALDDIGPLTSLTATQNHNRLTPSHGIANSKRRGNGHGTAQ
jgi:hypothetical protein